MKNWECSVCSYIHEGEEPPLKCPVCKADQDKFSTIKASKETARPVELESSTQLTKDAGDASTADLSQDQHTMLGKATGLILKNHLHPISVHSPNGMIPVAVIFLVLAVLVQSPSLDSAAYYNMIAVLLSMPLVLVTGYTTWKRKYNGAKTSVFKIKIAASCVATAILFGLIVWKTVQPDVLTTASSDRGLFLMWSLLLLTSVGIAGHLGGQLVFAKRK